MLLSSIKCPYDETECPERVEALESFKKAVEWLAKKQINQTIYTSGVARCPRQYPDECVRYQRYMNIVNRIKIN